MTRMKAVSLLLIAVLVLAISVAALVATELKSDLVVTITQENSSTLTIEVATPTESGPIMAGPCGGCSGGGSGGG